MQDKNTHTNDDLMNQGWSKMAAILDKEMPIKKDRKGLIFWLLGLLVLLMASAILLINVSSKPKLNEQVLITEEPLSKESGTDLKNDPHSDSNIGTEGVDIMENGKSQQHLVAKSQEDLFMPNKPSDESTIKGNKEIKDNSRIKKASNNGATLANSGNQDDPAEVDRINYIPISENEISLPVIANEIEAEKVDGNLDIGIEDIEADPEIARILISTLPRLNSQLEYFNIGRMPESYITFNQEVPIEIIERTSLHSFGAYAGVLASNSFFGNGVQVGLEKDFEVGDDFSMNIALGLTKLNRRIGTSNEFADASVEEMPGSMDDESFTLNSSTAYSILNSRSYLDLSIKPVFSLGKRFGISMGPSVKYLLKVKSDELNISSNLSLPADYLNESDLVKKIDFSMDFVMSYNINRNFGFSLLYSRGLQSIWDNSLESGRGGVPSAIQGGIQHENNGNNYNRYVGLRSHFRF